jgi:hypothetical protein
MTKRKPLLFFDPEHVDRPVPGRPWRAIVLGALVATAFLTAGWEFFWRGKGLIPGDYRDTNAIWAEARRKAKDGATVIIGSSRSLFDIDLDVWEELSGVRPVQLAQVGTSPRIFLKDLAEDESFKGLVIVDVTAFLFFTGDGGPREEVVKYYREQTLAQRADYFLSIPLEETLAFMDEQSRPKRQVAIWPFPLREGMKPRFDPRKLETLDRDRNARMWARVVEDPLYLDEAKYHWRLVIEQSAPPPGAPSGPMPPEAVGAVIAEVKANIDKIRARGGEVAFIRLPYDGMFSVAEDNGFPRAQFWDRLLRETASVGVAFQDHPELQGYEIPEWSHLAPDETPRYTRALVPILYAQLKERNLPTFGAAPR